MPPAAAILAEYGLIDPLDGAQLLRPRHAALYMTCSRRAIYNWIQQQKVETRRSAGGRLLVVVASLIKADADASKE